MAKPVVAVDDKLGNVRHVLQDEGFDVIGMSQGLEGVSAVVVSGMDDNLMGIRDRVSAASVINAEGMAPEQVVEEVRRVTRLH